MKSWVLAQEKLLICLSLWLGAGTAVGVALMMFILRSISGDNQVVPRSVIFVGWAMVAFALLIYLTVLFAGAKSGMTIGSIVLHAGLLTAWTAMAFNELFGVAGKIYIPEGKAAAFWFDEHNASHPLPFELFNRRFVIQRYEGSDKISHYESELSILEGESVRQEKIAVNHPLNIAGYSIFLSSYGIEPQPDSCIRLNISENGKESQYQLNFNQPVTINDGTMLTVIDYSPSLRFKDGVPYTFNKEAVLNPGYLVEVEFPDNHTVVQWVVPSEPSTRTIENLRLDFTEFLHIQYIVLDISKNSAKAWIYTGFMMVALGLLMLCFVFRRRNTVA